jgi:exosortase
METIANTTQPPPVAGRSIKRAANFKWVILLLPLGYLWFRLIDNLRLEWGSNPQYSFGWVVPLLVGGMLFRRCHQSAGRLLDAEAGRPWLGIGLIVLLAFLYLPTRLVEAATPEWRPIQWMLGIEAIGLTLAGVYLFRGRNWLLQVAFPLLFFLVAIPWPTLIEAPIIQGLTRMNAAMVVEVIGILGVPAVQHGNVIEVSTGMVGINDACSGIRSLQSSLMISLFLGEFYFLRWPFRLLFVGLSFVLAMGFNLCRASLLAWIAAKKGVAAIADYHDEAGFTILVACTLTLWGMGYWLSRRQNQGVSNALKTGANPTQPINTHQSRLLLKRMALSLIVWLALVETGVELWYWIRESQIKPGPKWSVSFPGDNATFKTTPFTKDEHDLLRFDNGKQGQWQEQDGTTWQIFYFNWQPGWVAGYLAKRHTPDICLPATGLKMVSGPTLMPMKIHGIDLPMRGYVFEGPNGKLQVFQCHCEPGVKAAYAEESTRFNLIRGIWAGRGNLGQKVLEVIITGYDDPELARQALVRQLDKLIQVDH